ncbi:MAG: glycosyltransferase family 39 protein, partial [Cyanobacteria bacterium]|nr:glycosyltransferase family 39 protein [Cyanobacteriota bacterium]
MAWLERDQRRLWLASGLGYLLLCWLAFFQNLGSLSLMDKTEALFVEVGHQMLERGDWITPMWNGELFFDYPVWGYWMVGLSFRLFGVSEWAARLPVALAASAVVLAGFALLWVSGNPEEGLRQRWQRSAFAAALLALNPGWIGWGRSSVTDMFLASAIALSLFGFFLSYSQPAGSGPRRLGFAAMPLFSAIAVLAKGPVGLVLPGLVAVVFLIAQGQLIPYLRRLPWLAVAVIFLAVVSPWYVLAAQSHGMAFLGGF